MSRYHRFDFNCTNRESLEQAIREVGLPFESVVDNSLSLFSYFRTDAARPVCLAVRKEALDATWNDLGFALEADGTYTAIVGDDRRGEAVLNRVKQEYTIIESTRALQAQGYTVIRQELPGGAVELVFETY